MSHYAVGIITKKAPTTWDLEEILEPYNENVEVDPYIRRTREDLAADGEEHLLSWKKRSKEKDFDERSKDYYENTVAKYVKEYEGADEKEKKEVAYRFEIENYSDKDRLDENGNELSTYNPDSKWDWWVVGGRFGDFFDTEEEYEEEDFKGSTIQLKDYPEPVRIDDEKELREKYPSLAKDWDTIQDGTYDGFYRVEYMQERYPTLKSYVEESVNLTPYAIVDENGGWHEPGEMGWWGMSHATTENTISWYESFYEKFIAGKDKDWFITIVDCHI